MKLILTDPRQGSAERGVAFNYPKKILCLKLIMRTLVQKIPRVLTGTHGRRNATSSCHMHTGRAAPPAVLVFSLSCFNPTKITLPPPPAPTTNPIS